jgi:hypothetical protein
MSGSHRDCNEGCQELDKQRSSKILGVLNMTQTYKGFPTRPLCQKNQITGKNKHKPVMVGDRTTYRTLTPKWIPFQNVINQ